MNRKFTYFGVVASLAFAQAASAQQVSMPLASFVSAPAKGTILCRGGSNVIMTADPEQSLPLQLVAKLSCGQKVALLSGNEGYSVNVLTDDGKNGYVTWMNVSRNESAPKKIILQGAAVRDAVVRWKPGTIGSDKFYSEDVLVESLTANGVTVQVSLQDTGWKLLAQVAIANGSPSAVNVVASRLALTDLSAAKKSLAYQDPDKLKSAYSHEILWTRATAAPSDSAYLAASEPQPYDYAASAANRQNYLAQHQETVRLVKSSFNPHAETDSLALTSTTVLPDEQVAGASWFQRDGKRQDMILQVPVGNIVYEFPFSFHAK
ncbi:MAG TPA: hypothetical protein VGH83_10290 [Candidatus Acidoferrum sp.]|jgi:hypothetical protein